MQKHSDFIPIMQAFVAWYLRALDLRFVKELLAGRTIEVAAEEIVSIIVGKVRGNRGDNVRVWAADYGAVMDRIAALHLRTRHGEDAVSQDAIPSG
jgi:hypothetical protein